MDSLFSQTLFGPQFKHDKGVDIVMGDIESLSTYSHYWKLVLVPHLLIGKTDHPAQPAQGWTCYQLGFSHSELGGSNDKDISLLLSTLPNMILQPIPYAEIPKQPCNPMLDSVNPVY